VNVHFVIRDLIILVLSK